MSQNRTQVTARGKGQDSAPGARDQRQKERAIPANTWRPAESAESAESAIVTLLAVVLFGLGWAALEPRRVPDELGLNTLPAVKYDARRYDAFPPGDSQSQYHSQRTQHTQHIQRTAIGNPWTKRLSPQ